MFRLTFFNLMFIGSVFSFRPIVETKKMGRLSMNISLNDNEYVIINATPSTERLVSPDYTETIYYRDYTEIVSRDFDKYSHWVGFANFSTGGSGLAAFSIRKSNTQPYNEEDCPVHFINGLIRDYGTGLEYNIHPVSFNYSMEMQDHHDKFKSGIFELGEHEIDIAERHRHLNDDNGTMIEDCGGELIVQNNGTFNYTLSEINFDISNIVTERRYLLLQISNDHERCNDLGVNGSAEDTLDIINSVSIFFESAGVEAGFIYETYIVLSAQNFFVDGNPWDGNINPNSANEYLASDILTQYRSWVIGPDNDQSGYHVSHIFTHEKIRSGVLGLAYVGVICFESYAVGLDKVNTGSVLPVYVTVHELGHNFGMFHDGSSNTCDNSYIMAPYVKNTLDVTWSECSVGYFNNLAINRGMECLLKDIPLNIWADVCGDGIVTGLEECDTRGVDDNCCDSSTCLLKGNAKCSYENDVCCTEDCQFIPFNIGESNFLCRYAIDECDVPEYCHGDSGSCPEDVTVPNGQTCTTTIWNTEGVCYEGSCINGDDSCYTIGIAYGGEFNDNGCVMNNCKKLKCGYTQSTACITIPMNEPDGLSCGENMQCLEGSCVNSTDLYVPKCGNGILDEEFGEECDCGSGDCFNIDDLCDARTCLYNIQDEGEIVYEWDLYSRSNYNADIDNWVLNSTGNPEFKYRANLKSLMLREGNFTRVIDSPNYNYYYIESEIFSRNMEDKGDECFLLVSTNTDNKWEYPEFSRLLGKDYEKDEVQYATGIIQGIPNNDLMLRFGVFGNTHWDTCFMRYVKVVGFNNLDSFNRTTVYNFTNDKLDNWLKISNVGLNIDGEIINLEESGVGFVVYEIVDTQDINGYFISIIMDGLCSFDYSVDRGLTWSEELIDEIVIPKRDSLLLRITLEDSLCYIYDIIVESLLVPTGIYTTL